MTGARAGLAALITLILTLPAFGQEVVSRTWQNTERSALFLPGPEGGPAPLIVALHGVNQSPAQFAALTGFNAVARRAGLAMLYPKGDRAWPGHFAWDVGFCCGPGLDTTVDDVGFVTALIDELVAAGRAKADEVYLVGFSNGGMLAHRIAAMSGDRIAAFAVISATIGGRGGTGRPLIRPPTPKLPLPAVIIHGTDDPFLLFMGGEANLLGVPGRYNLPVADAAKFWREADHCPDPPVVFDDTEFTLTRWAPCADGSGVLLYAVKGGEHVWPALLPSADDFDRLEPAAVALTSFLLRHRRIAASSEAYAPTAPDAAVKPPVPGKL